MHGTLIGAHDQMIAATARHHGYQVATLNRQDFERVPDLQLIDAAGFRVSDR